MFLNLFKRQRNIVASVMVLIMLLFIIDIGFKAHAQTQRKKEIKEEETFNRPEPSRPIQPEVPGVNRYQDDKVFLEYADSLYKIQNFRDTVERQILKGNVKFRQAGLWMFCDSAYYYPTENSLDAFSNVRMEQGDTLFVYADQLFYDGDLHLAKLKNGPTREKVLLINKDVTLTTDSLDYDMAVDLGWYSRWGTIDDKVNTLTSLYGEYSPKTKRAEFFTDVVLVNNRDGYTMLTDTLYYSTETHIANIESKTEIRGENDTIFTTLATYYTDTGDADLLSRSTIIHRDSTGNVVTLEGDSIIYDNATRISCAYMFRDPFKRSNPMVITDTAQKMTLLGGFGIYNDSTKEALATMYPLLMEYSQGDTLFMRADTIKTFLITEMIPDKRRKTKSGYPEYNGMPIVIADSTGLWIDTSYFAVRIPYVDTPLMMLLKAAPKQKEEKADEIKKETQAPTIVQAADEEVEEVIPEGETVIEEVEKEEEKDPGILQLIKQIKSENPTFPNDSIVMSDSLRMVMDSLGVILDSLIIADSISMNLKGDTVEVKDTVPAGDSIPYQYHVALAYHRARFFKQDMQGVADSVVFIEKDSMLYMFRKPIVWSEERQVTGNRIDVHFNDSTTDWAYLPEYGLISEHVDEDFYNQIFGKEIKAYFEGQGLRKMSVSGNVETIFLPQEEDSTYNRLVNAESSYLEAYLNANQLDWLKMWPEVSGTVTPIFLVKRNQMYLQKFKWWGFLRPEREWYGDRVRWADNLGEVPDELEQYFLAPSDFGEPKTFSATRVTLPSSSLPIWNDDPGIQLADSLNMVPEFIDGLAEEEISPDASAVNDRVKVTLPGDSLLQDSVQLSIERKEVPAAVEAVEKKEEEIENETIEQTETIQQQETMATETVARKEEDEGNG